MALTIMHDPSSGIFGWRQYLLRGQSVNRGQVKMVAAMAIVAFTCALPGCVTLARRDPMMLPQDQFISIDGYTTSDGVHHVCDACKVRLAYATAPDGVDASRVLISAPVGCTDPFGGCQSSMELGSVQSIGAEELASVEIKNRNNTAAYIVLAVVGAGVILLGAYFSAMSGIRAPRSQSK